MVIDKLKASKQLLLGLSAPSTLRQKVKVLSELRDVVKSAVLDTKDKEVKSRLAKIHNVADSLIGGLSTQEYTKKHVSAFRLKALDRLNSLIRVEVASPSDKPRKKTEAEERSESLLGDDDFDEQVEKHSNKSEKNLDKLLEKAPSLIKKYSRASKLLTEIYSKKFILAKGIPVVPLTTPIMSFDELKKMQFPVDKIGQYTVIEDQMVLGINVRWAKQIKKDTKRTPSQFAEDMVKQMNARTNKHFMILGPAYGHKVGFFFWIAPEHQVDLMIKATGGLRKAKKGGDHVPMNKRLVVTRWGFAF